MDFIAGKVHPGDLYTHEHLICRLEYLPQVYSLYSMYTSTYHPYIAPILRYTFLIQSYLYRYIFPLVFPLYTIANNALQSLSSDSPDLLTLLLFGIILLVSFKVLDYMRRAVMFWVFLALRCAFYVSLAGLGVYVYQRGPKQSVEDFGWVAGLLEGLFDEGQRVGDRRAKGSEREAQRAWQARQGGRRRTRGAGW